MVPALLGTCASNCEFLKLNLWAEQYHPIDLHPIEKRESVKYSEKNWIKMKEKLLIK